MGMHVTRTKGRPITPRIDVFCRDVETGRGQGTAVLVVQDIFDDRRRLTSQVVARVRQERQQQHVELMTAIANQSNYYYSFIPRRRRFYEPNYIPVILPVGRQVLQEGNFTQQTDPPRDVGNIFEKRDFTRCLGFMHCNLNG